MLRKTRTKLIMAMSYPIVIGGVALVAFTIKYGRYEFLPIQLLCIVSAIVCYKVCKKLL